MTPDYLAGFEAGARAMKEKCEAEIEECAHGFDHNYPEEARSIRIAGARVHFASVSPLESIASTPEEKPE